jgi:hypothetical protein
LYVVSFLLVYAGCVIVLKLMGRFFYRRVKINPITFPNKIGGGIFGILKGVIVLSLLFLLFVFPTPLKDFDSAIGDSALARPIRGFVPLIYDNTGLLHPKSNDFLTQIQNGILLSNADLYSNDPQSALKDKVLLGMSDDDVETLDKLREYFGKAEE